MGGVLSFLRPFNLLLLKVLLCLNAFSNRKIPSREPFVLGPLSKSKIRLAFQKSLEKAKRRIERERKAKIREEKKAQAASV